jgi:hypothetical protein
MSNRAAGRMSGLVFALLSQPCLASPAFAPVEFDFDSGPPPFYYGGTGGVWRANGGNPDGYISESTGYKIPQNPTGAYISNFVGNFGMPGGGPYLFGVGDYGSTVSFAYRTSASTTGGLELSAPVWVIGFGSDFGGETIGFHLPPGLPFEPDNGAWTHFEIAMTRENFPDLPADPAAAGAMLARLQSFSISLYYLAKPGSSGSATLNLDIDSLAFGTPTPEPSSLIFGGLGLVLLAFGCIRRAK